MTTKLASSISSQQVDQAAHRLFGQPVFLDTAPLCLIVSQNGNKHWTDKRASYRRQSDKAQSTLNLTHDSIRYCDPPESGAKNTTRVVLKHLRRLEIRSDRHCQYSTLLAQASNLHQARKPRVSSKCRFSVQYIQLQASLSPSSILLANRPVKILVRLAHPSLLHLHTFEISRTRQAKSGQDCLLCPGLNKRRNKTAHDTIAWHWYHSIRIRTRTRATTLFNGLPPVPGLLSRLPPFLGPQEEKQPSSTFFLPAATATATVPTVLLCRCPSHAPVLISDPSPSLTLHSSSQIPLPLLRPIPIPTRIDPNPPRPVRSAPSPSPRPRPAAAPRSLAALCVCACASVPASASFDLSGPTPQPFPSLLPSLFSI